MSYGAVLKSAAERVRNLRTAIERLRGIQRNMDNVKRLESVTDSSSPEDWPIDANVDGNFGSNLQAALKDVVDLLGYSDASVPSDFEYQTVIEPGRPESLAAIRLATELGYDLIASTEENWPDGTTYPFAFTNLTLLLKDADSGDVNAIPSTLTLADKWELKYHETPSADPTREIVQIDQASIGTPILTPSNQNAFTLPNYVVLTDKRYVRWGAFTTPNAPLWVVDTDFAITNNMLEIDCAPGTHAARITNSIAEIIPANAYFLLLISTRRKGVTAWSGSFEVHRKSQGEAAVSMLEIDNTGLWAYGGQNGDAASQLLFTVLEDAGCTGAVEGVGLIILDDEVAKIESFQLTRKQAYYDVG